MTPRMSALDPAGPQAGHIASLWDIFLWVAIVVWALVVAFTIAAAINGHARRRREGEGDPLAEEPARDRRLVQAIVAAGGLTVLTLIGLLVASTLTGSALADLEDDADALHVRITGHQWWWQIEYEHDDPRRSAMTANELHVPVGRIVHLQLTATDVIHSFWVPSVHGKKDLIPGRQNRTWIRIDEPGVYRGQCAEFCGMEHAKMAITVVARPPAEFDAWLAHQRQPAPEPATPSQAEGKRVFLGGPCVLCHTITGTPAGGRLGPDLTHFASRSTIGAGATANTRQQLMRWITDPHAFKPGVRMPPNLLADSQLHPLVDYLESLR